jgi:ATP-dependent DNA ligase
MKCLSTAQLHRTLNLIIDEGGEGVMVRMPTSVYEPGRSMSLIKFKVFRKLLIKYSYSISGIFGRFRGIGGQCGWG